MCGALFVTRSFVLGTFLYGCQIYTKLFIFFEYNNYFELAGIIVLPPSITFRGKGLLVLANGQIMFHRWAFRNSELTAS